MLSLKALKNIEKTKRWAKSTPKSEPDRIVECDEDSQVYNWQRTYKKAAIRPLVFEDKKKKKPNGQTFKKNKL